MSKLICSAAIRGAHTIIERAEQHWRQTGRDAEQDDNAATYRCPEDRSQETVHRQSKRGPYIRLHDQHRGHDGPIALRQGKVSGTGISQQCSGCGLDGEAYAGPSWAMSPRGIQKVWEGKKHDGGRVGRKVAAATLNT